LTSLSNMFDKLTFFIFLRFSSVGLQYILDK